MRVGVIGGGPAGAIAAQRLAAAGASVRLYRPERQGEKPCGGAVPAEFLEGAAGDATLGLEVIDAGSICLENASGAHLRLTAPGLAIYRRADFDSALQRWAQASGAELVASKVRSLEPAARGVRMRSDEGADEVDWLVAADGARGLGRRTLGLADQGDSVGLGASIGGIGSDELVLSFPDVADSYCWIFPRPGGISVGIAYSRRALSGGAAEATLMRFLRRHSPAAATRLGEQRCYRYPIPVYGPWTLPGIRAACRSRILLVGDAAAIVDPLTREGIRPAMQSAIWAAEALLAGDPASYARRVAARLSPELERAARARRLFYDDPMAQWMIPLSRFHPGVRRVLSELLTCRRGYRGLRRELLAALIGARPSGPGGTASGVRQCP